MRFGVPAPMSEANRTAQSARVSQQRPKLGRRDGDDAAHAAEQPNVRNQ